MPTYEEVVAFDEAPFIVPIDVAAYLSEVFRAWVGIEVPANQDIARSNYPRHFRNDTSPRASLAVALSNRGVEGGLVAMSTSTANSAWIRMSGLMFCDATTAEAYSRIGWAKVTIGDWKRAVNYIGLEFLAQNSGPCCELCDERSDEPLITRRHSDNVVCRRCWVANDNGYSNTAPMFCESCNMYWLLESWGNYYYCDACAPNCADCNDRLERNNVNYIENHGDVCENCYGDYAACVDCERLYHTDSGDLTYSEEDDCYRCYNCNQSYDNRRRRINRGTPSICLAPSLNGDNVPTRGFGVEIEAHFDHGVIPLGEYHSLSEAPEPFFSKWRAEADGSIYNGGEIISPVLSGTTGVAEVIATMAVMKELEASVTGACGQHIHIDAEGLHVMKVQSLTTKFEDLMIALTGSFRRWGADNYAGRLKLDPNTIQSTINGAASDGFTRGSGNMPFYGRNLCAPSAYGTVEFRYPPGTLNPTQFALNHGIVNFVAGHSSEIASATLLEFLRDSQRQAAIHYEQRQRQNGSSMASGGEWVHLSILDAAKYLRAIGGWTPGGEWKGMGFKLGEQRATVTVTDENRSITREAQLPSETDMIKRINRELTNFYVSAHRISGWWSEKEGRDKAAEVVSVFA